MKQHIPVITLCGSTRFKDEFLKCGAELNLAGNAVFCPLVFSGAEGIELTDEQIRTIGDVHKYKILMSDSIMVINVDDYIGESTRKEIEFARSLGKPVEYRFPHKDRSIA